MPAGEVLQAKPVKGKVTDEQGQPLIGVTVMVKGSTKGAQTNANGEFSIEAPESATLVFSYIGHESQEVAVKDAGKPLSIVLKGGASGLTEIVVVGYGAQKKINLSGAVDAISGKALESRPITNIATGLQGLLPNLNIGLSNGRVTSTPSFNIRGATGLPNSNTAPFILVDNIPASPDELARLNPADVESITVLKDAASAAIYGSSAPYGALLITTKQGKRGKAPSISYNNNLSWGTHQYAQNAGLSRVRRVL